MAGTVGGEIAPRRLKRARRPTVKLTIVDVDLVRWVRGVSASAHDPHIVVVASSQYEGKRSSFAGGPRYVGNGRDRIS